MTKTCLAVGVLAMAAAMFDSQGVAYSSEGVVTNSIGMKLTLIPAGEFAMGSPESEVGREDHEGPQHRVRIRRSFYLGVYAVTQDEYEKVMADSPSTHKGGSRPVTRVEWASAVEFCRRLSQLPEENASRRVYRLPTEAEWEYACRAGSTGRWCFGDEVAQLSEFAWHYDSHFFRMPQPVGQKRPNAWGLYDMHGNVWEWVADWYDSRYYANSPVDDPTGPDAGSERVVRGGDWYLNEKYCRSAYRGKTKPTNFGYNGGVGFRVVANAPQTIECRIWSSADGRKVEGAFLSHKDGIVSIRRKSDGKTFSVPLARLSEEDRKWVADVPGAQASGDEQP